MIKYKISFLTFLVPLAFLVMFSSSVGDKFSDNASSSDISPLVKTHKVIIEDMEFKPAELVIQKGDKVIWENKGIVEHDITEFPDQSWSSSQFQPGNSWAKTIDESVDYYCSIHPTMKGKIIVR